MSEKRFENPPTKKVWIEPVVTAIDLRLARHGATSTISDSGKNSKS